MDVIELLPRLHLLRFPVGQAYLWRDGDELTLVDAGPAGYGAPIAEAVSALGRNPRDVRRIVLTHFHEDHVGGAGEFAALSGAEVLVHQLDAPVVRGEVPGPEAVLEDWERPLHERAAELLPQGDYVRPPQVTELSGDEVLDVGGGARVVHVPGHTHGSIALHLPEHGVLFTGDTVAASPVDGAVMPGVFNLDRAQVLAACRRLAELDADVACFGHGDPVTRGAAQALRSMAHT
ncbi:MBL fold metallo-hydrolase [Streptomyces violarus]|uniref:Glyoxylase-like metal-dependent hydrolase (Beta-lactamase superfamily II) n=1 Tax=Streptomyces violarus TaxID=67380 RepID=A0A7W5F3J2_9ACTN|nr:MULTISPECIES: MBL fold metallo-hydrolase [Streptomyces]MBB3078513.1 glyoxylase-like metal-dependent hydrolase (beta-lactamase superfamily II) [Streptomyces violarus]WRU03055.1 MBL fold metallo-hydrolase [Streptomyces sp. CGMCC 4.1772]GHD05574.1 MBL fold metallo-hydrolase [Streptomyces violarus]